MVGWVGRGGGGDLGTVRGFGGVDRPSNTLIAGCSPNRPGTARTR